MLKPTNQRGDTIVEVLIVILVIGVVLGSAYAVATRSLQITQLAQERGYALKLAEGQLERIKALATTTPTSPILQTSGGFCLDPALSSQISGGNPAADLAGDNLASYNKPCTHDTFDPVNKTCVSYCYYQSLLKKSGGALGDDSFIATVRWYGPQGARQQVQLSYKVYK